MTTDNPTPLIRYAEMTRATWRKFRPTPDGDTAAVSVDRGDRLLLMRRRLSASELFYSPPAGVYWVDVSVQHATLTLELPAAEGVLDFRAEVDLSWRITDPVQAVRDKVVDGEPVYRPVLVRQLRDISRTFQVDRFDAAEKYINNYLADNSIDLRSGIGLLSCTVKLIPEDSTKSHLKQRIYDVRKGERRQAQHDHQLLDARLKHDENTADHKLALQTTKHDQEIAELKEKHRLDLEQQRMDFYAEALRGGDLNVVALRLASHRDDVNEVIQLMMRQKHLDFEAAHGMLNALLEQRLVNRKDVQDIMARATKVIADHLSRPPLTAVSATGEATPELPASVAVAVEDAEVVDEPDDDDEDEDEDV